MPRKTSYRTLGGSQINTGRIVASYGLEENHPFLLTLAVPVALIASSRNIGIYKSPLEPMGPPFQSEKNGDMNWYLRK